LKEEAGVDSIKMPFWNMI